MADRCGVWLALILLGTYHGINPGMGWLFAVALGLQERKRQAVWGALVPIALGHLISVGCVALILIGLQIRLPEGFLRGLAAAVLVTFGFYRLLRARHLRWVGLRVGFRDLVLWSFLMATGHGAGLMLVPVLWSSSPVGEHAHGTLGTGLMFGLAAAGVHTAAYLATMGLVAWIVYEKVGVAVLRRAWVNLDLLWAGALIGAGIWTFWMR